VSKKTAALESTPAPLGKPGGPGLFKERGNRLPNYIEQVARGLLERGRVKDKSRAIQLAIGAMQRWARGGDNVSPEVRAAAAKALAQWEALKAKARAKPNKSDHSNTYHEGGRLKPGQLVPNGTGKPERVLPVDLSQPRRPRGNQGAGQWYSEPDFSTGPRTVEVPKVSAGNIDDLRKQLAALGVDVEVPEQDRLSLARDLALAAQRLAAGRVDLSRASTAAKPAKAVRKPLEDRLHEKLVARGMSSAKARRFAKRAAARMKRERITGPPTPAAAAMSNAGGNVVELAKVAPELRAKARQKAANAGSALPDGSFPVRGKGELGKAVQAWGRANPAKRARLKRHLLKRARALGAGQQVLDRIKRLKAA
jgi:hypothetical protein